MRQSSFLKYCPEFHISLLLLAYARWKILVGANNDCSWEPNQNTQIRGAGKMQSLSAVRRVVTWTRRFSSRIINRIGMSYGRRLWHWLWQGKCRIVIFWLMTSCSTAGDYKRWTLTTVFQNVNSQWHIRKLMLLLLSILCMLFLGRSNGGMEEIA